MAPDAPASLRRLFVLLGVPLVLLLALPIVTLLHRVTWDEFVAQAASRTTLDAIMLTAWTSAVATGVAVVMGLPIAYALAGRRTRLTRILEVLVDLPTVFPPAVAGLALLLAFGRNGVIGGWLEAAGIEIVFTSKAVVLAQIFVAAPYFIKSATVGLAAVGSDLREAAALDGADWLQTLFHITLPNAWRGFVTGAALCWARAVSEFGATIIFAGNMQGKTQTMTLAVYLGFEVDMDQALALSVVLLGASCVVLALTQILSAREER